MQPRVYVPGGHCGKAVKNRVPAMVAEATGKMYIIFPYKSKGLPKGNPSFTHDSVE